MLIFCLYFARLGSLQIIFSCWISQRLGHIVIIAVGVITAAYSAFVACIAVAGPLFASQVGYVVTLAGVTMNVPFLVKPIRFGFGHRWLPAVRTGACFTA